MRFCQKSPFQRKKNVGSAQYETPHERHGGGSEDGERSQTWPRTRLGTRIFGCLKQSFLDGKDDSFFSGKAKL